MDNIPDDELEQIAAGHCPDCGGRGFVMGPQGGMCVNIECAQPKCQSRFNVAVWETGVVWAQRIDNDVEWPPSIIKAWRVES
jgi:hypothetical protein